MASNMSFVPVFCLGILLAGFPTCLCQGHVMKDIVNRLETLETENQDLRQMLERDRGDISDLHSLLNVQSSTLRHQEQLIKGFIQKVDTLEARLMQLEKTDTERDGTGETNRTVIGEVQETRKQKSGISLRSTKERTKKQGDTLPNHVDVRPVFFHAVIKAATQGVGPYDKIVFPDVLSNVGGGYNNNTGVFTAPRPGVYIVSVSVESYDAATNSARVTIETDVETIGMATGTGKFDQGSVTVPVQLAAGDQVWTTIYFATGSYIYGNYATSFMVLLVVPM